MQSSDQKKIEQLYNLMQYDTTLMLDNCCNYVQVYDSF